MSNTATYKNIKAAEINAEAGATTLKIARRKTSEVTPRSYISLATRTKRVDKEKSARMRRRRAKGGERNEMERERGGEGEE